MPGDFFVSLRRVEIWLLLVIALLWQSVLTQTHVHFPSAWVHVVGVVHHPDDQYLEHSRSPKEAPAECPLCGEIGHAWHYLSPQTSDLPRFSVAFEIVCLAFLHHLTDAQSWHGWRSRAPPVPPQA